MGMSTHVVAIRPADERWRTMKAVWDACAAAGVQAPQAVQEFFDYEVPDEAGVVLDIEKMDGMVTEWVSPDRDASGVEIDLTALPAGVSRLRFYNSW